MKAIIESDIFSKRYFFGKKIILLINAKKKHKETNIFVSHLILDIM